MVHVALLVVNLSGAPAVPAMVIGPAEPVQTSSSKTPTRSGSRSSRTTPRRGTTTKPSSTTKPATSTTKPAATTPAPAPAADPPSPPPSAPPATNNPPAAPPAAAAAAAARTDGGGWLLVIAGLVAAVGGLQWWGVRQLGRQVREALGQTKDTADAAATSAAAAARALAASERAYLVARSWAMRPPAVGEIPEVEFIVENVGRTPARRTLVRGQIEVRETPLPTTPSLRSAEKNGGTLTIPPGGRPASTLAGDEPLTRDDIDRLRAATAFLSIWGRVDYEDVLGVPQSTSFAWRFDIASGALTYDATSDAYHEAT